MVFHAFSRIFDHELEHQARLCLSIPVRASYGLKYIITEVKSLTGIMPYLQVLECQIQVRADNLNRSGHTHLVRVEIGIENDDRICGIQVDSDAARSSTEYIDENIRVRFVKLVHALLAIGLFGVSVLERVKIAICIQHGRR